MKSFALRHLVPALLAAATLPVSAQADIAAGRAKAQACAVCHGPQGISSAPDAPSLAGQPEMYLVTQLQNYRSGKRPHEVMAVMAKPLTDADIRNLAAYYASLKIEVKP